MDATLLPALEAEDAHKIDRKSVRRRRVELITRGERRRRWSIEQKQEIVAESLGPDTTPTEVARKHAISSGLLYTWRQQLLGAQIGPPARSAPTFAQVEIAGASSRLEAPDRMPMELAGSTAPRSLPRLEGLIEIVLSDGVTLRVDAQVDGRALRRVLGALAGR
jgi:transposase